MWKTVAALLADAGYVVVQPEVGAGHHPRHRGCSLTVMWLDDELERLWCSPADTPAYRKGRITASDSVIRLHAETQADELAVAAADAASVRGGTLVAEALAMIAARMVDVEGELGRIDAVAGDGDHGRGMVKGTTAATGAADAVSRRGGGTESVLTAAGQAWAAKAGGTSGVLWGAALSAAGRRLGDWSTPGDRDVADALRVGYDAWSASAVRSAETRRCSMRLGRSWNPSSLRSPTEVTGAQRGWRQQNSRRRQPPRPPTYVPASVGPAHWPSAVSAHPTRAPFPWRCASMPSLT